ncbi:MAG: hypothetical protein LBN10_08750 [Propionibacteriaceae bacterium]|jgi:hypothetical protein|nr:hypothetical protein [Propionibacteriaceae bacterium]
MATSACPRCFTRFSADALQYAFLCTNPDCQQMPDQTDPAGEKGVDKIASQYYGATVPERPFYTDDPKKRSAGFVCAKCHTGSHLVEACPVCHCRFPLPDWRNYAVTTVAMAGAKTSGKSVYLAVMIHELMQYVKTELKSDMVDAADADPGLGNLGTKKRYENYYQKSLYEARQMMEGTKEADSEQRESLVYDLGSINGKRRALVLRDVAGEALERAQTDPPLDRWAFFSRADGVLFLYDTEREEHIRVYLEQDFELLPLEELGMAPDEILNQVLKLIRSGEPSFGIVLSKFDYIHAVREVQTETGLRRAVANIGAAFNRDPGIDAYPRVVDGQYVSPTGQEWLLLWCELYSLLAQVGADALYDRIETQYPAIKPWLFAVSSLGEPVVDKKVSVRGITPFRVLDPILWILTNAWASGGDGHE